MVLARDSSCKHGSPLGLASVPSEGVVATGFLAVAMLDEVAVDECGHVALDALGGDAGGGRDLRDGVAGVGHEAGEDDALAWVEVGQVGVFTVKNLRIGDFVFVRTRIVA